MLLPTPLSAVLGFVFILIGATAIWLIFEASKHSHDQSARNRRIRSTPYRRYLFIALFCFMTWLMLLRLKDAADELSLRSMLHILVAMVLAPLFLIKVLVARYYKSYTSVLVPLGLTIFTLGFVLPPRRRDLTCFEGRPSKTFRSMLLLWAPQESTWAPLSHSWKNVAPVATIWNGSQAHAKTLEAGLRPSTACEPYRVPEYPKLMRGPFCRTCFRKTQSIVPARRAY